MGNKSGHDTHGHHDKQPHQHHHGNDADHGLDFKPRPSEPSAPPVFSAIPNRFKTYQELQRGLRDAGLEVCELIIGTLPLASLCPFIRFLYY